MRSKELEIELVKEKKDIPFELLEVADPSTEHIQSYLKTGSCYIAKNQKKLIGVLVLNAIDSETAEIKNIAIKESEQGKGFGKKILQVAEMIAKEKGYQKLIIGTGNSSVGQLALYQKAGFEMQSIKKDFFLKNYSELIFENGIQCKHMVVLEKSIT
ncbi:aminoglycoside 6'-N-acetyltransferase I [Tenacibaculum sp. MAR_2009_124]|uniref:GNAT family N-acetyltransferase n=1 Tax=Tenacibaculum sp. MAR_2009_124 TaxID=1250059 RepID=UPI00089B0347|nr:GNAT family N-acetyltransferase [Tenacibaculum sp. MAR_2009_124]SEC41760.1 aminoglycoside 6'-N-acetyltransferase I [Tenacibaculum sp. MAR_2009_124]